MVLTCPYGPDIEDTTLEKVRNDQTPHHIIKL